ncbi:hypothetical protein [Jongsikchunia kroppenstedtii]|uniref:hypothetical protein n=1 Tax=Jongsikchunia kroppenstedtii TaxID=1121721 RepID=UPI001FDF31A1|nr:hypothetical protein [Jongsikchunia kroppenstedtii]
MVFEVRALAVDELGLAVDLLLPVLREVPLHRWLLGECADDREVECWLIEIQLVEHLRAGYVLGGFDGAELLGVVVWSPAEPLQSAPDRGFEQRSIELLRRHPEFVQRLAEFKRACAAGRLPHPDVEIVLAGYAERARGTDLSERLLAPAFAEARREGSAVWMATAARSIGASAARRFGFGQVGEYKVGPVTMHVHRSDPASSRITDAST